MSELGVPHPYRLTVALLFIGGGMNLLWIVLLEKILPLGAAGGLCPRGRLFL